MNNNVYNKERYKGWGDTGTKAMRRLTKEVVDRFRTRSIKKYPCKRNKGEHTFEKIPLPNARHSYLHSDWRVIQWGSRSKDKEEDRWLLFVCSACGKEEIKYEERPYNPTNTEDRS